MNDNLIITIIVVFVIYLNVVATYHVVSCESYEPIQKKLQILISWLVPLLGSVVVISFALSDKDHVGDIKSKNGAPARVLSLLTLAVFVSASSSSNASAGEGGIDITSSSGSDTGGGGGGDT